MFQWLKDRMYAIIFLLYIAIGICSIILITTYTDIVMQVVAVIFIAYIIIGFISFILCTPLEETNDEEKRPMLDPNTIKRMKNIPMKL